MNITIPPEYAQIIAQKANNFTQTCEINQYNMISNLERYPKIIFYLGLAVFLFLFIDRIILPHFKKAQEYIGEELIKLSSALSLALIYFITLFTFKITEETYKYISIPLWMISIGLLIGVIYTKWKQHTKKE